MAFFAFAAVHFRNAKLSSYGMQCVGLSKTHQTEQNMDAGSSKPEPPCEDDVSDRTMVAVDRRHDTAYQRRDQKPCRYDRYTAKNNLKQLAEHGFTIAVNRDDRNWRSGSVRLTLSAKLCGRGLRAEADAA